MNLKFTNFILKHQKFYDSLNNHIKYVLQHDLDFYADELYLYKDSLYNFYVYIGKNGPDYCLFNVDFDIAFALNSKGSKQWPLKYGKLIFVSSLTGNYVLVGKTKL